MQKSTDATPTDPAPQNIRVVLADDHELIRAGLRIALRSLPGVEVVAEADDGRMALAAVEKHLPDILVMDISMKGLNGIEATAHVAKDFPHVRVLILSMHSSEDYIWQALRAGAAGYLLKGSDSVELGRAITTVAQGERYLAPVISKRVVENYLRRPSSGPTPVDQLNPRHREILQLIAEGKTTKKIAMILELSPKTVETYRTQLMDRLDIHDLAGLVRFAIRNHLADLEA